MTRSQETCPFYCSHYLRLIGRVVYLWFFCPAVWSKTPGLSVGRGFLVTFRVFGLSDVSNTIEPNGIMSSIIFEETGKIFNP